MVNAGRMGERVAAKLGIRVCVGLLLLGLVATYIVTRWIPNNKDILATARSVPNGGGYCSLTESGVPETIKYQGITILPASRSGGSYCCGFTFLVAMRVASERGLFKAREPHQIKRFQREWYGATRGSAERQLVTALENLGIGREIDPRDAKAGDFVVFHQKGGSGHSVIFLDWIKHDGVIVGLRYRSSQIGTNGVGDSEDYFVSSRYRGATVDPGRFYVGRLNGH